MRNRFIPTRIMILLAVLLSAGLSWLPSHAQASAQVAEPRDPAEPLAGKPNPKLPPRPGGAVSRQSVDEKGMRALIQALVACGTRNSLSSWNDPLRGIGCGRDFIVSRMKALAEASNVGLRVVVDPFEATSPHSRKTRAL